MAQANAVARVWHHRLGVIGGGFVVGRHLIATCAHLVAALLADLWEHRENERTLRRLFTGLAERPTRAHRRWRMVYQAGLRIIANPSAAVSVCWCSATACSRHGMRIPGSR